MGDYGLGQWVNPLLDGLVTTVILTVVGAAVALIVSFVLGLLVRLESVAARGIARTIIELFRGTSLLVQLFWMYYVIPQLTGYSLNAIVAGVVALGLNFGAYGSEVVRGSINAVPKPQWEGSVALNFTSFQRMRRVILPQAVPLMLPPFGNLVIQLLKSTPLVYLISVLDFYTRGYYYWQGEGHFWIWIGLEFAVFFVLAYLATLGMHFLERQAKARLGQREKGGLFAFKGPGAEEDVEAGLEKVGT